MQATTILIVDDEPKIVEAVEAYLKNSGYQTITAFDGRDALDKFERLHPDMVVLDLMLPSLSGEAICKEIRQTSRIPIIMLTAKVQEDDKINGLVIGADDYITKPFSPRELVARVNSLFRRCSDGISPVFNRMSWNDKDLEIDLDAHILKKKGLPVNITPNEYKLFSTLIKHPHKTFTRDQLIEIAFGMDFDGFNRTIDSHIKNLRSKIETDSGLPEYILTVRGVGYKFGGTADKEVGR
ncbi:response regulator transcription factor [Oscillospiraceae bacterium PP1C4]